MNRGQLVRLIRSAMQIRMLEDRRPLGQVAKGRHSLAMDLRLVDLHFRAMDLHFRAMDHHRFHRLEDLHSQAMDHRQELALEDHRLELALEDRRRRDHPDHQDHQDLEARDLVDQARLEDQPNVGLLRRPGPLEAKVNLLTEVGSGSSGVGPGSRACRMRTAASLWP